MPQLPLALILVRRRTTLTHTNTRDAFPFEAAIGFVGFLVGCLTSQQQASVSQGRICSDNFTCCHTEIEVADPTFYLTQSQYTDTGPTSPSADPITPGAWQGSHWSANFLSHCYDSTPKKSRRKRDSNPGPSALEADVLTTRPTRRSAIGRHHLFAVDVWACLLACLLACLTSQQHASVSQGRICSDNFKSCHTEMKVADQTFHPTQSQYTDTGPTSPTADPLTPGRVSTRVPIFKSLV